MALSDFERRRLEELEQGLIHDAPDLVHTMDSKWSSRRSARRAVGVLALVGGFALVLVGVAAQLAVVGILGFLLTIAGTMLSFPAHPRSPALRQWPDQHPPATP